jgi:hypothetical protein
MKAVKVTKLNSAMQRLNLNINQVVARFYAEINESFNLDNNPNSDKVITFLLSIDEVIEGVEKVAGMKFFTEDRKKTDELVTYRQFCYYILTTMGYGPSQIASRVGYNHATVIHGKNNIEDLLDVGSAKYMYMYIEIIDHLKQVYANKKTFRNIPDIVSK